MASVMKNTAIMTLASVLQKVISFGYFAFLARALGAGDLGKYGTALSLAAIMVVCVDMGFTNVFIRESSKTRERIQEYLSTVLSAKILFGIGTYLALLLVAKILRYESDVQILVALAGITMLLDSVHLTLYGAMRALGTVRYEARGIIFSQFATFVFGAIFLSRHFPLWSLMMAFIIPSLGNILYAFRLLQKKYRLSIRPRFEKTLFRSFARLSFPFALAAIFARLYGNTDLLMVKSLAGNHAAGLYSTPYKISTAFQFIPLALIAATYPAMSAAFANDRAYLTRVFHDSFKYLLMISLPIAFGIFLLAPEIILFIFDRGFEGSIQPLKYIILGMVFTFLSFPIGALLNASNKQATQTAIMGVVMVINLVLDFFLIQKYGITGAAIASLIGSILLPVAGFLFVSRIIPVSYGSLFQAIIQVVVSVGAMGGVIFAMKEYVPLSITILLGGIVYIGMIFLLRVVTFRDVKEMMGLFRRGA